MRVAVIEGDGIGKEVIPIAKAVLEKVRPDLDTFDVEVGYGRWQRTGCALGDDEMEQIRSADLVLFGAITTPPDPGYRSVLLRLRRELDLYANVRPIYSREVDLVIVRENTEGLYSGIEHIEADRATTTRVVTKKGSERIARKACAIAATRWGQLTVGNKANVIKSDVLFRDTCMRVADEEGIEARAEYIDALCLNVLQQPDRYDVIVTTNIFGDILSDVSAYLVGGLGMLPSANIGDEHALFEPVHGSAPDIAGRGIANPVAAIRSVEMMLDHIGEEELPDRIEAAIQNVLMKGIRTPDLGGTVDTRYFGKAVLRELDAVLSML